MRFIESDENLSMRGDALEEAICDDIKLGLVPFWVSFFLQNQFFHSIPARKIFFHPYFICCSFHNGNYATTFAQKPL